MRPPHKSLSIRHQQHICSSEGLKYHGQQQQGQDVKYGEKEVIL